MAKIRLLDQATVNMIAAGEVIDRPASVVKELMENSLDASATQISISIQDGGRRSVAVIDNGCGMDPEDLALAFEPHATSKVSNAQDLFAVRTYGFRGEALASIAAVSAVKALSRTASSQQAYAIEIDFGSKGLVYPCSGNIGTAIYVRDLFYKAPARQKFLRSAQVEFEHIVEQFIRIALGVYGSEVDCKVDLTLNHNGRLVYRLTKEQDLKARVEELFPFLADNASLIPVDADSNGVCLTGLIGSPVVARGNARLQYVFLNGRYIRDRSITHAIRTAYECLLDPDRHSVVFLFIRMDPGEFDVNVHPRKEEVRFYHANLVHQAIADSIRKALLSTDLAAPIKFRDSSQQHPEAGGVRKAIDTYLRSRVRPPEQLREPAGQYQPTIWHHACLGPKRYMQVHDSYIVLQTSEGLEIVDQHALHEMILYNRICRQLDTQGLVAQTLLIGPILEVSEHQLQVLNANSQILKGLAVGLERVGPRRFKVLTMPAIMADADPVEFVLDLLDLLDQQGQARPQELLDAVVALTACRAAIKAGQRLTDQQIEDLLQQAQDLGLKRCPHGRPTGIRITLKDLDRQFLRT